MREFESEHILYREMTVDDTDNVLTWRNSEAVRSQFFYQDIITREDHLNYIDNKIKTGKSLQFILKDKETGEEFGCCYFSNIEGKIAEIGIFFGVTNLKGKGYGKETIKQRIICLESVNFFESSLPICEYPLYGYMFTAFMPKSLIAVSYNLLNSIKKSAISSSR